MPKKKENRMLYQKNKNMKNKLTCKTGLKKNIIKKEVFDSEIIRKVGRN
jgi:hypothetical protein